MKPPGRPPRPSIVVATPIGNLDDVTLRALKVLGDVALILAEDTRRTRKLLSSLRPPHASQVAARAQRGCPGRATGRSAWRAAIAWRWCRMPARRLVSDPGYPLVCAALEAGVPRGADPRGQRAAGGAHGIRTAHRPLSCSSATLPRKKVARRRLLGELASEPGTLVFLESPRRLAAAAGRRYGGFGRSARPP